MNNLNLIQLQNLILNKKNDFNSVEISWKQIKTLLENLQNERMADLTVSYIHKDDWPDDEELQEIEEEIYFVDNIIKETKS